MQTHFTTIIIGSGPAGYTAAIYACRAGYTALVLEKLSPGGQMGITSNIENYPGFPTVDGFELTMSMQKQAKGFGAVIKTEEVISADLNAKPKTVTTAKATYTADTVVIATGAKPRLLGIKGEAEFTGRGVSYCASCDGMFFKEKTVIVNGGGDTAIEDVLYLSNVAKHVIIVHRRQELRASRHGVSKAKSKENISFILNSSVEEIRGENKVTSVVVKNKVTGELTEIPADGIFVAIGRIPDTDIFKSVLKTDGGGYIIADESCKTEIDGVYAAGDVRTKALRQIVTAAADGANAVKSIEDYLNL